MKHIYKIDGMTCEGCVATVTERLMALPGVGQVDVNLERAEANISMSSHIPLSSFKAALGGKYSISEASSDAPPATLESTEQKSKWQQLRPLFLIFFYIISASILLNFREWNSQAAMLDFMGLFFIVFSFFKFLDLKGFPDSFRMYDPLAKALPLYGWAYPFIELILGLMFLMRIQINVALVVTLVLLGITTVGVTRTLLDKKSIRCACLGTSLKLPMTEATFIENSIMLVMALAMLLMNLT
ncbi:MAG: heavy-metal-associated domain-containing protein [Flavobacteriaceae bacterium]